LTYLIKQKLLIII